MNRRQYIEFQMVLMIFQLGYLTNSIVRRVTLDQPPPDTIFPIVMFALCSTSLLILFLIRRNTPMW